MIILILLSNVLYVSTNKDEKIEFYFIQKKQTQGNIEINWNSKHL